MATPISTFQMETNFSGLIQLLAKHLYSDPDVFIRELVQNSHDAIHRRRALEPNLSGRIDISVDSTARTITFIDNGIGMGADEIRQFLSVIGSSGTLTALQDADTARAVASDLIGQFGIGFLSAFLVASRVDVRTLRHDSRQSLRWRNDGSLTCHLFEDDLRQAGTQVVVYVSDEHLYALDSHRIESVIRKYCDFIPFPITLNGHGPINEMDVPFYRLHWENDALRKARYDEFVRRRYSDIALDVIPFDVPEPFTARGVLLISDRSLPDIDTGGVLEIFIRRMAIKSDDTNLLPRWAKFVRGVVDSSDLEPTAARDNYKLDHPSVAHISQHLGRAIVDRLTVPLACRTAQIQSDKSVASLPPERNGVRARRLLQCRGGHSLVSHKRRRNVTRHIFA